MARIPELTRENVPEHLREAYDAVMAAGKPIGPSSIAVHSPEVARRRRPLSDYLRFETGIEERLLELAILVTARCLDCPYVWNAHAEAGRKVGLDKDLVHALCWNLEIPKTTLADEQALIAFAQELLRSHTVRKETFNEALQHFSIQHLVELTSLISLYAQNVFYLNAFGVELPADSTEPKMPVGVELEDEY